MLLAAYEFDELLAKLPPRRHKMVLGEWRRRADDEGHEKANEWLMKAATLPAAIAGRGFEPDDGEIIILSERAAADFSQAERRGYSLEGLMKKAEREYGLNLAVFAKKTPDGIKNRLKDEIFWRRQLRRFNVRNNEKQLREIGAVSRLAGLYVSTDGLKNRQEQKRRNASLLAHMAVVNELGQEYTLEELSALGNSNPVIRRAELMVRIRGFEEIAKLKGHIGEFFTLTCPSKFHRMHHYGKPNEKYNGATPREAVQYLNKVWARIRAELKRLEINVYGFRVAEPHHDGTPHWHGLLFMQEAHRDIFRRIVAKHGCREERQELGLNYVLTKKEAHIEAARRRALLQEQGVKAPSLEKITADIKTENEFWAKKSFKFWRQTKAAARVDFESINWNRGSAAGYIAKYIAKNIDGKTHSGESVGVDFEAEDLADATTTAQRVDAWASIHGTRQFQQIGGVPVTLWRELRRIVPADDDSLLMLAQRAADRGDWSEFVRLMGGEAVKRADIPLALYKEEPAEGAVNKYGEPAPAFTLGVLEKETGEFRVSRPHTWEKKPAGAGKIGGAAAAWTCVNNCTKQENPAETVDFQGNGAEIDFEEYEFKEWLVSRKGFSWTLALEEPFSGALQEEYRNERMLEEQIRQPISAAAAEKQIKAAALAAEKAAADSEALRFYREYLAMLDAADRTKRRGIIPAEPKFDLSKEKIRVKPQRYTPPSYDTVETAIEKARAAMAAARALNRSYAEQ